MKLSFPKLIVIVALSLATWVFSFTFFAEPLTDSETMLVVAWWVVVVFMADRIWVHLRKRKGKDAQEA